MAVIHPPLYCIYGYPHQYERTDDLNILICHQCGFTYDRGQDPEFYLDHAWIKPLRWEGYTDKDGYDEIGSDPRGMFQRDP